MNDLVSIIMLCHNGERYLEETVGSVLAQTYQNWELIFVDDFSNDKSVSMLLDIMNTDKNAMKKSDNPMVARRTYDRSRISITHTTNKRGETHLRNEALKTANGRWIAFLDVGDVWEPTKLERQIHFMEKYGYAMSYTKYGLIGSRESDGQWQTFDRGVDIGGKEKVTYSDMLKCCWPAYLTVMYDQEKIGQIQVKNLNNNNDYAIWLKASQRTDCYLLNDNLAKMRTPWSVTGRLLLTNRIKWRYEVYRNELCENPFISGLMTLRNMCYGLIKWGKYVSRSRNGSFAHTSFG